MTNIYTLLDTNNIPYERFDHPAAFTCEQADAVCPEMPGASIKNLFLYDRKTEHHFLVIVGKEKQVDLEKTKKEYDDIVSQVNQEKTKLDESERLKKLIKSQEQDLIRARKERLKIIEIITKEKENISKKTKEEQEKLHIQSILAKQLENEKKTLEKIKQKRVKAEKQIKIKNQKLKDQQRKIKKQIIEKNQKLKSLNAKSVHPKPKKSGKRYHENQDLTKL